MKCDYCDRGATFVAVDLALCDKCFKQKMRPAKFNPKDYKVTSGGDGEAVVEKKEKKQ